MALSNVMTFAFLLVVCNLLRVAFAASDSDRLSQLKSLSKDSKGHLISMSVSQFRDFAEAAPRSYNLISMFSADPQLCQPCEQMREQLRMVSDEFSKSAPSSLKPTFFLVIKLSQKDAPFLSAYGIQHVPILYHFESGSSKSYPKRMTENSPNSFNVQQFGFSSNVIKQFVNERIGSRMRVVRGGYEIPFVQTVKALKPYLITIVLVFAAIALATGAYKNPMLWFGLVVLVYIFSVGGGHYSWIHNTPLAVVDKNGRTQYIAGGNRSQYVAEGFFVSFTCVCISGLVIAIQEMPAVIPAKSTQTFLGATMFTLTIAAIGSLLVLYQTKMPSYLQYSEM